MARNLRRTASYHLMNETRTTMPRTIKRYENRKLYDTEASAYVSLADIAALVRRGETVEVIDNATGADITAQTLTQVILDAGKRGSSPISVDALHALLRRGGHALDTGIEQIRHGVDDLVQQSIGRVSQLLQPPRRSELQELRSQLRHLESLLENVLAKDRADDGTPRAADADPDTDTPS